MGGLDGVLRLAYLQRAVRAGEGRHLRRLFGNGGGMAVRLHQQQRPGVNRQAEMNLRLHTAQRGLIQKLQRAGVEPGRDDRRDGLRSVLQIRKRRQHRGLRGGARHQLQQNFGHYAQRALGTNE